MDGLRAPRRRIISIYLLERDLCADKCLDFEQVPSRRSRRKADRVAPQQILVHLAHGVARQLVNEDPLFAQEVARARVTTTAVGCGTSITAASSTPAIWPMSARAHGQEPPEPDDHFDVTPPFCVNRRPASLPVASARQQRQYRSPEDAMAGGAGNGLPAVSGTTTGLGRGIGTLAEPAVIAEPSPAAAVSLSVARPATLASVGDTLTGERPRIGTAPAVPGVAAGLAPRGSLPASSSEAALLLTDDMGGPTMRVRAFLGEI